MEEGRITGMLKQERCFLRRKFRDESFVASGGNVI